MTKDVVVTIKGIHGFEDASDEELEVVTVGQYTQVDDFHVIEYEECADPEGEIMVQSRLMIGENQVELNKSGGLMTQMIFKKDFRSMMQYKLPFGTVEMTMEATDVQIDVGEDQIEIQLQYNIEMGGVQTSSCQMQIGVRSRHEIEQ